MTDINNTFHHLDAKKRRIKYYLLIMLLTLIVITITNSFLGEATISLKDGLSIIIGKLFNKPALYSEYPKGIVAIIWDIRLPRIICSVFVGMGLALSGTVFQGLLMNPLADPYTLGISSGAALGATVAIFITAILQIGEIALFPAAFIGAFIALLFVLKIGSLSGHYSSTHLIIAGIITSSIASALISLIKSLSGEEVSIIVFWLMGSLAARTWTHCLVLIPMIVLPAIVIRHYAYELNIICTGEKNASNYGVDVKKVRLILLICASIMTAACVTVSGIIGFVGLVVPHIMRQTFSSDHKLLIPLSAISGGLMLLLADSFTRVVLSTEIPVGVLTTLIGGPFFIYQFVGSKSTRKGMM